MAARPAIRVLKAPLSLPIHADRGALFYRVITCILDMVGLDVVNLQPDQDRRQADQAVAAFCQVDEAPYVLVSSRSQLDQHTGAPIASVCSHGVYVGAPESFEALAGAVAHLFCAAQTDRVNWTVLTTAGTIDDAQLAAAFRSALLQHRDHGQSEIECALGLTSLAKALGHAAQPYPWAVLVIPVAWHRTPSVTRIMNGMSRLLQRVRNCADQVPALRTPRLLRAAYRLGTEDVTREEVLRRLQAPDDEPLDMTQLPSWLVLQLTDEDTEDERRRAASEDI